MRAFFSHHHRDKPLVREIVKNLPPWLKDWVDESRLCFGDQLAPALKDAIDSEVDYVVLLFNEDAAASEWVKREINWAKSRETELGRTFVLPIVTEGSRKRLSEFGLADRLTLDLADHSESCVRALAVELGEQIARRVLASDHQAVPTADALQVLGAEAVSLVTQIPGPWRQEVEALVVQPFVRDLGQSRTGVIPLSADIYYQRVFHEMRHAGPGSRVLAVSTLTSDLWTRDADQTHYATLNIEAIERGAEIRRLFVLPEAQLGSFEEIIRLQHEAGITTRVCSTGLLAHVPDLADFVLFAAPAGARCYAAEPSIIGTRPIRSGSLILTEHEIARKRESFAAAWDLAAEADTFFLAHRSTASTAPQPPPPGLRLEVLQLDSPVVTCEEAAKARNIPLARELKTLLLQTSDRGIVAVHLPGDGRLSLKKVKTRLETAQAYLADPDELSRLGLAPGTVSAILEPVWSMTHLISNRLLKMDAMMTNNGTLAGYFEFDPAILTEALDPIVDDFEE